MGESQCFAQEGLLGVNYTLQPSPEDHPEHFGSQGPKAQVDGMCMYTVEMCIQDGQKLQLFVR